MSYVCCSSLYIYPRMCSIKGFVYNEKINLYNSSGVSYSRCASLSIFLRVSARVIIITKIVAAQTFWFKSFLQSQFAP